MVDREKLWSLARGLHDWIEHHSPPCVCGRHALAHRPKLDDDFTAEAIEGMCDGMQFQGTIRFAESRDGKCSGYKAATANGDG